MLIFCALKRLIDLKENSNLRLFPDLIEYSEFSIYIIGKIGMRTFNGIVFISLPIFFYAFTLKKNYSLFEALRNLKFQFFGEMTKKKK